MKLLILHRLDQWLISYPVWTLWIGAACAFTMLAAGMASGLIGVTFAHPAPQADTRSLERGALRLQQLHMQFGMDHADDAAWYPLAANPDLSPLFRGPGRAELYVHDVTRPVGRLVVPDGSGDGLRFLPEDQDGTHGEIAYGHQGGTIPRVGSARAPRRA